MKLLKNHADSETNLGDQRSDIERRHLSLVCGKAAGLGGDRCLLNFQLFLRAETSVEKPEREKCHTFYGWLHQKGGSFATCSVDDQGGEIVCWIMFIRVFQSGFLGAPTSCQCCAGAMDPQTSRLLAEKQKQSLELLLSKRS